jgi:predicted nucleotidyltransferase
MNGQDIIATLRANEKSLRARGIRHAALFGSVARGTAGQESDIDIMIEIDSEAVQDVYAYVGLKNYVAKLFTGPVDVIDRAALKPHVRPPAEADAVYAF